MPEDHLDLMVKIIVTNENTDCDSSEGLDSSEKQPICKCNHQSPFEYNMNEDAKFLQPVTTILLNIQSSNVQ